LPLQVSADPAGDGVRQLREFSARRQYPALRRQMGGEGRVMLFDDPIKKGLLGPVALVTASIRVPSGIPCRRSVGHDSHPCDTVLPYSLSPGAWPGKKMPYPRSIMRLA
jgi:hypothetical protein